MYCGSSRWRASEARICERTRSTGCGSKRGSASASASSSNALSRCSVSVISEPVNSSSRALKRMRIARASSACWKAWLSSSPAPSSSRPETMFAKPSLPLGSSAVPPRKLRSSETIGLAWSSTSQAVMPPGLTTSCTSTARAGSAARTTAARIARPRRIIATAPPPATSVAGPLSSPATGPRSPTVRAGTRPGRRPGPARR